MHKVSFVIPVYNADKYIEKCVNSILNQTYGNKEIILVNDGSKDNSLALCERLSCDYENITCINQINSGPSSARNTGIEASSGDFLQFVDADDYIDFDMTQQLIKRIRDDNSELVICGYRNIYLNNDRQVNKLDNNMDISEIFTQKGLAKYFYKFFTIPFVNSLCNKLYKSNVINENGIRFDKSLSLGEDLLFNLGYLKCCDKISIESSCYYNYLHRNSETLSNKYYAEKFENQSLLFNNVRDFLKSNNEYNQDNKQCIEHLYAETILFSISELYSSQCDLRPNEVNLKLKEIVNCEQLINALPYYKSTNLKSKIISLLVKYKQVSFLNSYYRIKNVLTH